MNWHTKILYTNSIGDEPLINKNKNKNPSQINNNKIKLYL